MKEPREMIAELIEKYDKKILELEHILTSVQSQNAIFTTLDGKKYFIPIELEHPTTPEEHLFWIQNLSYKSWGLDNITIKDYE